MLQTHFTEPKMRTPRCLVGASHAVSTNTGFAASGGDNTFGLVGYFTVHHGHYQILPVAHGLCGPTDKPSVLRKYFAWPVSSRTQNRSWPYLAAAYLRFCRRNGKTRAVPSLPQPLTGRGIASARQTDGLHSGGRLTHYTGTEGIAGQTLSAGYPYGAAG
jgi:hypothetical protein